MGFPCAKCGKHNDQSKTGIEDWEGHQYVVCNYCDAENEIIGVGGGGDDPVPGAHFQVIGILKRR